jgi:hypothetical protein
MLAVVGGGAAADTGKVDAGNNWSFFGFEGQIEAKHLQAVDQVHLNNDGTIDQLIIYLRPLHGPEVCGSHHSKTPAYEVGSRNRPYQSTTDGGNNVGPEAQGPA